MKTNLTAITVLVLLTAGLAASCGIKYEGKKLPAHPRILLLSGEEAEIKKTIASDPAWHAIHQSILDECHRVLDLPPVERIQIGRRLLDKSREALKRIFYLSYAWRMTGDDKYSERAEKEMLAVSAFSDWNPSHFLDVAEMTMAVSIGYDWLFDELSSDSREIIRKAIVEKGLKPSLEPQNSGWLRVTHNWNQVCNAGMTYGALAVFEDEPELAASLIERADSSILLPMEDYNPDGAYPEGYSYWGYGTSFNVMYLAAVEKALGKQADQQMFPGFFRTAGYLENMTGPTGLSFNYSDCGAGGSLQPAMFWLAGKPGDPSLLWTEKTRLLSREPSSDRLLPSIMIWGTGMTADKITPPQEKIWVGQGKNPVALMRSSWSDPDAIFAGLKAGSPSVNHGHMDIGSFVMEAGGIRWAMDFGMQNYNSLETAGVNLWGMAQNSQRWDVFRYNNFVHNTLTVNGKHQNVAGRASIISWSGGPGVMNAVSDITQAYGEDLKKAVRGIAIVDESYVMVRDEIETNESGAAVRWNLLTSAEVKISGNNEAELTKEGKVMIIKVREPARVKISTRSTVPPNVFDAPNPGTIMVGFEVKIPANSSAVFNVLLLPEGATENKKISSVPISAWPK